MGNFTPFEQSLVFYCLFLNPSYSWEFTADALFQTQN